MKAMLKGAVRKLLGRELTESIVARLRPRNTGFSEATLIEYYFAQRRDGLMVDVGAHYGETSGPYLRRGWTVHAFEPDSRNLAELHRHLSPSPKLHLHEVAVSDHEADGVPFFTSEESHGISSLSAFRPTHREAQRVRLVTLSSTLTPQTVSHVDFLKVDAEGYDLFVLRGFPWERLRPEVILCEFEDRKTLPLKYDYRTLGNCLLAAGYTVYLSEWWPIIRYGTTHCWRRWQQYPCSLCDPEAWGNFVAFRPGADLAPVSSYLAIFQTSGTIP